MTVEIVSSVSQAIEHINRLGSHHTDCIVTQSRDHATMFTQGVDSACTFVNASSPPATSQQVELSSNFRV
jgi:glutamate-5-semialdehyde dehydrogenase